jgi:hypothetical protein
MQYVFGDYTLDVERRELRCRGQVVPLRPKVLDLLVTLIRQRDQMVAKQALLSQLWPDLYVSPATLSACIKLARPCVPLARLSPLEPHGRWPCPRGLLDPLWHPPPVVAEKLYRLLRARDVAFSGPFLALFVAWPMLQSATWMEGPL